MPVPGVRRRAAPAQRGPRGGARLVASPPRASLLYRRPRATSAATACGAGS
jgi:hypothetical protein